MIARRAAGCSAERGQIYEAMTLPKGCLGVPGPGLGSTARCELTSGAWRFQADDTSQKMRVLRPTCLPKKEPGAIVRARVRHGLVVSGGQAIQGCSRELGWGGRVARLPSRGTLIFATDMQGNWDDYCTLKDIYQYEDRAGNEPVLLFCGDLVHGPGGEIATPARWPDFLGAYYEDRSDELILDFMEFSATARAVSLLGNHEHAHVGGPVVSKFHADEAAVLEDRLGSDCSRVCDFMRSFPLLAVAPCGGVFTHGAPRETEPNLEAFEALRYDGYEQSAIGAMYDGDTLGALLWSRHAEPEHARALLEATRLGDEANAFVAYGHDVVREGFEKIGDEQLCLSTSFGCDNVNKFYLRLDLGARYHSVNDLRIGHELLQLYPDA